MVSWMVLLFSLQAFIVTIQKFKCHSDSRSSECDILFIFGILKIFFILSGVLEYSSDLAPSRSFFFSYIVLGTLWAFSIQKFMSFSFGKYYCIISLITASVITCRIPNCCILDLLDALFSTCGNQACISIKQEIKSK